MGQIIDNRYEIINQIGEGGMGSIYLAKDNRLGRNVALKRLRLAGITGDAVTQFQQRFEREAQAMANLQHPYIVTILDYGRDGEGVFLVMEYLPNGTLKERMGKIYSPAEAAELLSPIAEALHYLHERGMVHRDIKPANILFDEHNNPRLADFGVVKLLDSGGNTLTAVGAAVGTPAYMAPELIHGVATPKTDQYALGIVCYELVTGKQPFQGRTPMDTMYKQRMEPLPNPKLFNEDLPENTMNVLQTVLAKQPEQRYDDILQFVRALAQQGQGEVSPQVAKSDEIQQPVNAMHDSEEATELASSANPLSNYDAWTGAYQAGELAANDESLEQSVPQNLVPEESKIPTDTKTGDSQTPPKKKTPKWVIWVGLAVALLCISVVCIVGLGILELSLEPDSTSAIESIDVVFRTLL